MAWYRTLGPVTYTDGDQVRHITKAGIRIDLTPTQAAELAGMIVLDRTTPFTYPRADFLKYDSAVLFPVEGIEDAVYLANDSGLLYRWINDDYATVGVTAAWGDIDNLPAVIAAGPTEADAQAALGGTATGRALFTADDAAAGRTALGSTGVGDDLFTSADQITARAVIDASPLVGRGNAIVFMGDSHTERGSIPRQGAASSIELGGMVGMILTRVPSLRYRFNAGITGEDTNEMIVRWQADVIDQSPTALHLLGGTNDITGGVPQATTIANLRWMVRDAKRIGCVVFIGTIPPRDDTDVALDNIERLNVAIKSIAATEGAHLIDYHAALVDPATGHFFSGLTSDQVHANTAGQKIMAVAAAAVMNRTLPQGGLPVATCQYPTSPNRLGTNACFLTDSNADGVPDYWTASGSAAASTISLVDDPEFIGKAVQIEFTTANQRAITVPVVDTLWDVGQRVAFCGKFKASVEAGSGIYRINLAFNNSTETNYGKLRPVNDTMCVDTEGVGYFYIEGVIPTGTNIIYIQLNCVSGSGTVKLGQIALWVLDNEGVPV